MQRYLMSQPQSSKTMQRWLIALLVAMMTILPSLPVAAVTPTAAPDEGATGVALDPEKGPNPLLPRKTQPLLVSHATAAPTTETVSTFVGLTPTVTVTTTVTTELNGTDTPSQSDPVPADDAYQAWKSRPAVTRAGAYPVRIQIPALQVDTFVEQLGERADGSMATPTNPSNVAWYSYGAIPGENGNVVMAGHLDRADGSPAAFWDLAKLKAGDEIIVYDSTQTAYHYTVTEQQSYPYNKAPLAQIFGFDLVSRLNLITCRGNWDRNRQTYSQRLVVYTELVEIVPATAS